MMGRSILGFRLILAVAAAQTGNFAPSANLWAERIRKEVLDRPDFSKIVPPTSNRSLTLGDERNTTLTDSGTDVFVQIKFFKVQSVKAAEGWLAMKVWLRMAWMDTRLAWNASDFGGVDMTYFQGTAYSGAEENEIWIPDITPYNAVSGIIETLEASLVRVRSDGWVYYSRPGTLEVMCKFSGLVAFPYDDLKCTAEFGGWILSGGQQGLQLLGEGFDYSLQEDTSGSSYQEYAIKHIGVTRQNYAYECCPSEPWPVIKYHLTLTRSSSFYEIIIILPSIIITLLSFAVFWTDTNSADSLGYGIGVIVVNLLANLVLMDLLPICGELIWIDIFAVMNTIFCVIALFQSAFNIMLENYAGDTLLPIWLTMPVSELRRWLRGSQDDGEATQILSNQATIRESVAGVLYRARQDVLQEDTGRSPGGKHAKVTIATTTESPEERSMKLIFFERLFFMLDEDSSLFIDRDECESLLSYAALDVDPADRAHIMQKFDSSTDGKLNRVEFVQMCATQLWAIDIKTLELAVENLRQARKCRVTHNKAYWTRTAELLDVWARIVIPAIYFLALILVFNLELTDEYGTKPKAQMFQGLGQWSISKDGIIIAVVYSVIVTFLFILGSFLHRIAAARVKAQEQSFKQAARAAGQHVQRKVSLSQRNLLRRDTASKIYKAMAIPTRASVFTANAASTSDEIDVDMNALQKPPPPRNEIDVDVNVLQKRPPNARVVNLDQTLAVEPQQQHQAQHEFLTL